MQRLSSWLLCLLSETVNDVHGGKKTLKHTLQNYIIKVHSVEMFHGTGQQ